MIGAMNSVMITFCYQNGIWILSTFPQFIWLLHHPSCLMSHTGNDCFSWCIDDVFVNNQAVASIGFNEFWFCFRKGIYFWCERMQLFYVVCLSMFVGLEYSTWFKIVLFEINCRKFASQIFPHFFFWSNLLRSNKSFLLQKNVIWSRNGHEILVQTWVSSFLCENILKIHWVLNWANCYCLCIWHPLQNC